MVSMSKPRRDRISELPDELLSHILSFLPSQCAVKTCILSPRWKNIWSSVPVLYFNMDDFDGSFSDENSEEAPVGNNHCDRFIDQFFRYHDSSDMKKIHLKIHPTTNFSWIDNWICTAVGRNVVELDLLSTDGYEAEESLGFPQSLFMCKTLEVLRVFSSFENLKHPSPPGRFPNLKFLEVYFFQAEPDLLKNMFTCCPMLEELVIGGLFFPDDVNVINVVAPKLKRLRTDMLGYVWGVVGTSVFLLLPHSLNTLISESDFASYNLDNANGIVNASIECGFGVDEEYQMFFLNRLAVFLSQIRNVTRLSLHIYGPCLEVWYHPFNFVKLKEMKLKLYGGHYWEFLGLLLTKSPELVDLTIVDCPITYNSGDGDSLPQWEQPEAVPACLLRNLSTITIKQFRGYQVYMDVAQYLLKNGHVMNKITIYTKHLVKEEKDLYKEFLMFERRLMNCKVEFIKG